jgi:hypothetical protein
MKLNGIMEEARKYPGVNMRAVMVVTNQNVKAT